jgi:FkbM family methyltransferase
MKRFEITQINFDDQMIHIRINHPIQDGYLVMRDIDLGTTMYKAKIWDVQPGLTLFFTPTPKFVFDFGKEDFGGFEFQIYEGQDLLETQFIRLRFTNLINKRMDIKDYMHPVFLNYREFFIDDMYGEFDLENCTNVIDAGASIGLFTRYMLRKGVKNIISIEPDPRSVLALRDNFFNREEVTILPKALTSEVGTAVLNFKDDNPIISTLDKENSEFIQYDSHGTVEIETTNLDQVFKNSGWDKIDLLKLDIEGAEYDVLGNISNEILIATDKILLEYHFPEGRLEPIINKLSQFGFYYQFLTGSNITGRGGNMLFYK